MKDLGRLVNYIITPTRVRETVRPQDAKSAEAVASKIRTHVPFLLALELNVLILKR
jgi:hypothetical protein